MKHYYVTVKLRDIDADRNIYPSRSFQFPPDRKIFSIMAEIEEDYPTLTALNYRSFLEWLDNRARETERPVLDEDPFCIQHYMATWTENRWLGVHLDFYWK